MDTNIKTWSKSKLIWELQCRNGKSISLISSISQLHKRMQVTFMLVHLITIILVLCTRIILSSFV